MEDRQFVELQLGRPPRGSWQVARRCSCGRPQVIRTERALEDGTPFPTLWWLTCKTLVADVGRLEAGGLIAEVNQRLAEDGGFKEELRDCTVRYCEARDGASPDLRPKHPGGGPDRVKCLHAHLAHYLVTGDNPVGQLVLNELARTGEPSPDPVHPCV